jgi:23S rRNA pseudouridine1911/1915/1917 synthase
MTEPISSPDEVLYVVPVESDGARLGRFLAQQTSLPRARIQALLQSGAVQLDGRICRRKGEKLRSGTRVQLDPELLRRETLPRPRPELSLNVLGESEGWIAIDKPAGMPVHPLRGTQSRTVLNFVVARRPQVLGVGEGGLRSGIVHRLDVDTSGVLLLATDARTWSTLRGAFRTHRVDKVYHALVHGRPPASGRVELAWRIARHRPSRVEVMDPDEPKARLCATRWRLLQEGVLASLVEIRPRSGHLHQIRATFAHFGHPLIGDRLYAPQRLEHGAQRHMLHASRLSFDDIDVHSDDPEDFRRVWAALRGEPSGTTDLG